MNSKLIFTVIILAGISSGYVYADTPNFSQCYTEPNHHCMTFQPTLNQAGGTNEHVTIFLPQNGANQIDGIYSMDNYTSLKSSPFVGAVENIYSTTSNPTLNFCPNEKYILENQGTPEYLDKLYNKTIGFDITGLVYPPYCYVESGPNPINGNGINTVPEFGPVAVIVLAISVMSLVVFTANREIRK